MILATGNFDLTKLSVFSLMSTTTTIAVNNIKQKKNVVRYFDSMYRSIFFMCRTNVNEMQLEQKYRSEEFVKIGGKSLGGKKV